jgi:hypothetical protein
MKYLFAFLSILALVTMACGFTVDIPDRPTPGPLVTDQISIRRPGSDETRLKIQFGAGELKLSPGAEDMLVEGTAKYNVPNFKPIVIENEAEIVIKQDEFKSINVTDIKNEWDLKLGDTPMELEINAGAYEGRFDLGGLALTGLVIKDGASDVGLDFSSPNQAEMSVFRYETGASAVEMTGLANANFSTMFFNGGAGDYRLEFSGDLQKDATMRVETGFADLALVIPEDVDARVTVEGAAVNVNPGSGWGQSGQTYTQDGSSPSLTIIVKMTAGNVTITN